MVHKLSDMKNISQQSLWLLCCKK